MGKLQQMFYYVNKVYLIRKWNPFSDNRAKHWQHPCSLSINVYQNKQFAEKGVSCAEWSCVTEPTLFCFWFTPLSVGSYSGVFITSF